MTIETLRERVPLFANARNLTIAPLSDVISLNNANYRVHADGSDYLVRVGAESPHWLGIRRDEELAAARAAANAGIAPEILFFAPDGLMVTPFIVGRHWQPTEFTQPENTERIGNALRRLHEIQGVPAAGSMYERIERLLESAATLGLEPPANLPSLQERLHTIREQRAHDTRFAPCLCHNDLYANNFLDDGTNLWLIDWEFAGIGDGLLDVATVAIAGHFSPDQQARLLTASGYTNPDDSTALESMKFVVWFFDAAWGLVLHGLRGSEGDFDYLTHSQRVFAGLG